MDLNEKQKQAYIEKLKVVIEEGSTDAGCDLARQAMAEGVTPLDFFSQIVQPVLIELGDAFSRLEVFLPELMKAGMVIKAVQKNVLDEEILKQNLKSNSLGKIVIGTCQGDIHDIGKSMVALMLQVNGFSVVDLGVNVTPQAFIETAQRENADIIAMSSLLTTSLPFIKDVINRLAAFNLRSRFKVIAGGAAINPDWAASAGLDGFGRDAVEAIDICLQIMKQKGA
jgi:methylmalonyl-CoA mutase cobalamin-binding domain/chain